MARRAAQSPRARAPRSSARRHRRRSRASSCAACSTSSPTTAGSSSSSSRTPACGFPRPSRCAGAPHLDRRESAAARDPPAAQRTSNETQVEGRAAHHPAVTRHGCTTASARGAARHARLHHPDRPPAQPLQPLARRPAPRGRPCRRTVGRLHTFRHTCASLLFAAGKNVKQVQVWLGHADPGFTVRTSRRDRSVGYAKVLRSPITG